MDYEYCVTSTYDGKPHYSWTGRYDNALEAVNVYNSFKDIGGAHEYRTINLSEPNGKMHTKIYYANGTVGGK